MKDVIYQLFQVIHKSPFFVLELIARINRNIERQPQLISVVSDPHLPPDSSTEPCPWSNLHAAQSAQHALLSNVRGRHSIKQERQVN